MSLCTTPLAREIIRSSTTACTTTMSPSVSAASPAARDNPTGVTRTVHRGCTRSYQTLILAKGHACGRTRHPLPVQP